MGVDDFIKLFQGVGFPAAIAIYLLWRIDPLLRLLAEGQAVQTEILRRVDRILDEDEYLDGGGRASHRRGKLT